MAFSVQIAAQLSLENAWLPPIFVFGFQQPLPTEQKVIE